MRSAGVSIWKRGSWWWSRTGKGSVASEVVANVLRNNDSGFDFEGWVLSHSIRLEVLLGMRRRPGFGTGSGAVVVSVVCVYTSTTSLSRISFAFSSLSTTSLGSGGVTLSSGEETSGIVYNWLSKRGM